MSSYLLVWGWQRSGWWLPSLVRCPRLSGLHLWLATVISSTFPTSFLLFLPRTKLTLLLRAAAGMRKPIIQNVDNKAITLLFLVTLRPSRASLQYRKQFVIKQIYCILQQAYKSGLKHQQKMRKRWRGAPLISSDSYTPVSKCFV